MGAVYCEAVPCGRVLTPTVVRMSDHGPWRRYKVTDGNLDRYVVISVQSYQYPKPHDNIAHFIACGTSLHQWAHYFEAYRAHRDIPAGFTLTDAGRELLAAADEAAAPVNLDSSVFANPDGTPYVLGELPDIPHKSTITITRPK